MPLIKIIGAIKIYIYFFDHIPPHFHAIYAEHEELIIIETLETYSGGLPGKKRKEVIQWAKENQKYLMEKWNECNPNS